MKNRAPRSTVCAKRAARERVGFVGDKLTPGGRDFARVPKLLAGKKYARSRTCVDGRGVRLERAFKRPGWAEAEASVKRKA